MRRLITYCGIGLLTFVVALIFQTVWSERDTIINWYGAELVRGMD